MNRISKTLAGLGLVVGTAACGAIDPMNRPGTWQPNGANDANLAAMVANPQDLNHGVADTSADGQVVAASVNRYRTGKVKELPDSLISKIAPISINNNASGASAGGS